MGIIVAALGLLGSLWGVTFGFHGHTLPIYLAIVLYAVSVVSLFIIPMIDNKKVIAKAYKDDLLDKAIEASIDGSKQKAEINKYSHFLLEILKADRLNPLMLDIDGSEYDNLFSKNATVSITEAPLFAWKNPEYSWFLITHYTAVLLKRIEKAINETGMTNQSIRLVDRDDASFTAFMKEGFEYLGKVSKSDKNVFFIDGFVRFFFLSEEEVLENKALCEQIVAGHELFGIHAFIVDMTKILTKDSLCHYLKDLRKIGDPTNKVLDIMVFEKDGAPGEYDYKIGKNGLLTSEDADEDTKRNIRQFIVELANIVKDNKDYLIYPSKEPPYAFNRTGIKCNKQKTFLSITPSTNS